MESGSESGKYVPGPEHTHGPFLGGGRRDIQMNRLTARPPVPLFTLGPQPLARSTFSGYSASSRFYFQPKQLGEIFFISTKMTNHLITSKTEREQH